MTIQWGDTGKVAIGALKTFTFTSPTPNETLLGSPVSGLPTTNPGSAGAQISYTIQQSDLPTISPAPISTKYSAIFMTAGKNTDAAAQTINYQVFKNGTSHSTGNISVPASNFWTLNSFVFDVKVGDVISVALWSASANMNYDYYGISVVPTRPQLSKNGVLLQNYFVDGSVVNIPSPIKGTPAVWINSAPYFAVGYRNANGTSTYTFQEPSISWGITIPAYVLDATYGAFFVGYGDSTQGSTQALTHATNRPRYARSDYPGKITFREVLR